MRMLRLISFASIFCLVSISASGQQTTSSATPLTASDPRAVALVQRSLGALIGSASVNDVTLTGTVQRVAGSDDDTGTATLTATVGGDSKISLNLPSGLRSEIRNSAGTPLPGALPPGVPASAAQALQSVGAWSGPDGALHPIVSHNLMNDAAWFFPALTLANLASQNYVVSYIGQETINGQSVVHLSSSRQIVVSSGSSINPPGPPGMSLTSFMQQLSQMEIYLDPTTSLPVALAFNAHPDGNALVDIPTQVEFSNYQKTAGVQVPLHVQKYLNNNLVLDLQFTNATLNSGLSASAFQLQ
jgi:hypothetical protein